MPFTILGLEVVEPVVSVVPVTVLPVPVVVVLKFKLQFQLILVETPMQAFITGPMPV